MSNSGEIPFVVIIGFGFLMLGLMSFGIQMAIRKSNKSKVNGTATSQREKDALAEAIRRHPELANGNDPESLRQLRLAANEINQEMKTAEILNQVKQENEKAERAKARREQEKRAALAEAQRAQMLAANKRRMREEHIARTANYSLFKRTIARNKLATAAAVIVILGLITWGSFALVQEQQAQVAAAEAEAKRADAKQRQDAANEKAREAKERQDAAFREKQLQTCKGQSTATNLDELNSSLVDLVCAPLESRQKTVRSTVDVKTLSLLALDKESSIREGVARNSNASATTLDRLSRDTSLEVRINVATNSNAAVRTLVFLSSDINPDVRMRVGSNRSTPVAVLAELATSKEWDVRSGVARNIATPIPVLEVLSNDRDNWVRYQVASNPSATSKILKKLEKDKSSLVSDSARRNLDSR